jgi:hypothetical protein
MSVTLVQPIPFDQTTTTLSGSLAPIWNPKLVTVPDNPLGIGAAWRLHASGLLTYAGTLSQELDLFMSGSNQGPVATVPAIPAGHGVSGQNWTLDARIAVRLNGTPQPVFEAHGAVMMPDGTLWPFFPRQNFGVTDLFIGGTNFQFVLQMSSTNVADTIETDTIQFEALN